MSWNDPPALPKGIPHHCIRDTECPGCHEAGCDSCMPKTLCIGCGSRYCEYCLGGICEICIRPICGTCEVLIGNEYVHSGECRRRYIEATTEEIPKEAA